LPAVSRQANGKPLAGEPAEAGLMSGSADGLTPRSPGEPEPDLTSLLVIHRAIRRDLARLTATLARSAGSPSTPTQRTALRRYGAALFAEISSHFDDEDCFLWPLIAATAGQCVDLGPLTDDHQAIMVALGRAVRAIAAVADRPSAARAAGPVQELRDLVDEHIADEEAQVLPASRRYLSAQAYRSYEAQAWRRASLACARFRAPWLAQVAGPRQLPAVLGPGGERARLLLVAGRRRYARLEHRSFGSG
jgi:hypothetical protein